MVLQIRTRIGSAYALKRKRQIQPRGTMGTSKVGEQLRQLRMKAGLTTRDVSGASRKIAEDEGNPDFLISHARLVQIERGGSTPSVHKLFTLSAVYGVQLNSILSLYFNAAGTFRHHLTSAGRHTHLLGLDTADTPMELPERTLASHDVSRTNLLSRVAENSGDVPANLLQHLKLPRAIWGVIGLDDYTMYPILRPGSLVHIDGSVRRTLPAGPARSEHERPIYFVELRDSYLCSWCELHDNRLICIPHPQSAARIQEFAYPREAELVGQVTAAACRLVSAAASAVRKQPLDRRAMNAQGNGAT